MPSIPQGLIWMLAVAFGTLAFGSAIRLFGLRWWATTTADARQHRRSLWVWWGLLTAFSCALLLGRAGLALLFCVSSLLALEEFHRLFERRSHHARWLAPGLGVLTVAHYCFLAITDSPAPLWFFPAMTMILVAALALLGGHTREYLRTAAGYYWGAMLVVYGVSHAVATTGFSDLDGAWTAGPVGWCAYLVFLTEVNDIAQALIGRTMGRIKIAPELSPGKTWEGWLGGLLATVCLAMLLGPRLTTFYDGRATWLGMLVAAAAGGLISICGFLGDVNMSGLKREAGVKDSSARLPGMGGVIDRIDSLTISAPAFYYFVSAFAAP